MEWILNNIPLTCTFVGVIGILYSLLVAGIIKGANTGEPKMIEIANAIQEGSIAYLNRQLKSMAIVGIVIFIVIFFGLNAKTGIGFLVGAVASYLAGYIGMRVSVLANLRVAEACKKGLASGLSLAFKGGSVTGMLVAGLALTAIAGYFTFLSSSAPEGTALKDLVVPLVALGFGGSLVSIFARLGGGIFTKGADVGADLVGKVEAGIPEDDPRNPATIADNVGDNVGDCAGMAADLFETYAVTVVATMLIAFSTFAAGAVQQMMILPLLIGGFCIVASVIGTFFVKLD